MTNLILTIFIFINILYFVGLKKNDFSIIDIAWGLFFVIIYSVGFYQSESFTFYQLILGVIVFLWAIRLSLYILLRSLKAQGEDYRYAQWRADWKDKANIYFYFKVYILQACLALLIGFPLYLIHFSDVTFGDLITDYLGLGVWLLGFLIEVIADYQKSVFKKNSSNKGKILKTGLWRYSRHPNYFGESLCWWGIYLVCISSLGWWAPLVSPVLLTFLLLRVSGVSLLEQKYVGNTEYDDYKKSTSAFVIWFKKEKL